MDQYCTLILLWFFSPIVDSLRGIQQAAELDKVRKHFGVGRASLGSLSEGVAVFDPEPLREIAQELFDQLPDVSAGRFDLVGQTLTAVDGSVVETLARVARLSWLPKAKGKSLCGCRLHTQFEVLRGMPSRIDVTDADRAAGVVNDEGVTFDSGSKRHVVPDHPVRIVTVRATPHRSGGKSSGGRTGSNCDGFLRIAMNRLDLPAELISEMDRLRWLIENFFRMFKQLLGCRHLLSTKPNGLEIQVSCGIIACLLVMLSTGRHPTKRSFEMVCFFLSGWASPEDLERHINALPQPA